METLLDEITLDKKRRLAMGRLLKNKKVSSFEVYETEEGYLLKPKVSIPAREAWLFQNKQALTSVLKGLEQAKQGKVTRSKEDFSKYIEDEK